MAEGVLHINRAALDGYSDALDAILAECVAGLGDELYPFAEAFLYDTDPVHRQAMRDAMSDIVYARMETAITRSQAEADGFFDELSDIGGWGARSTEHDFDPDLYEMVSSTVRRSAGNLFGDWGDFDEKFGKLSDSVSSFMEKEVGYAANGATSENVKAARKRGAKDLYYASVPAGFETCTFCIMQASRDFCFTDIKDSHWHKGCRCRAVAGKKGTKIPGYDPKEYEDLWRECKKIDDRKDLSYEDRERMKALCTLGVGSGGHADGIARDRGDRFAFDADDSEEVEKVLNWCKSVLRDQEVENALIMTADGRLWYSRGTRNAVSFDGAPLEDSTIIHNHPESEDGGSFGEDDFMFLRDHPEIRELWAVDSEYDYRVSVTGDISELTYNQATLNAGRNTMVDNVIDDDYKHLIMEGLNRDGYVDYRRERISSRPEAGRRD